jgi:RNA polymerase sigma factor (sigma-70 family)
LLRLLKQYRPFIFKTARKFNIKSYDINDLEQIGYMAIINALAKYRTGSCTFSTYTYESIKNAFKYTSRQNSKHERELSYDAPVDPLNISIKYTDCISSPENLEETVVNSQEVSEIKKAVSKLPPQEMELILSVYYKGVSLKDYAAKKGITYNQASRKKDFILTKLGSRFKQ